MKLQIEITPEQKAILQRRARRAGLELSAYLQQVMDKATAPRKRGAVRAADNVEPWTEEEISEARPYFLAAAARAAGEWNE